MMDINTSSLISVLALIYYGALLVVILRQKNLNKVRIYFSVYLVAMTFWSASAFMIFAEVPSMGTLFWNRMLVVASMAMPAGFLLFVLAFLGRDERPWLVISLIGYAIEQVLNVTGQVIVSASSHDGVLTNEYGPALPVVSSLWVFFIGYATFALVQEYRRSKDEIYRNRLRYLLVTFIVIIGGNLTNLTPLGSYPSDISANILAAMLITFAILRHQLLDLSAVVRKGILYSIPTIMIGATYYLVIQSVLRLFPQSGGLNLVLLSIATAILTALVVQPFLNRAQSWLDRLFFREKYDASLMLERISRTVAHVLDLERITDLILREVTETLHIKKGAILIKWQNSGDYLLTAQHGLDEATNIRWSHDHPIIQILTGKDKSITIRELRELLQNMSLTTAMSSELDKLQGEVFIPLNVKDDLVGVLILGLKRSELNYTDDDQLTLNTLANQTAVAIENARLFSAEQSRREELDALYDLTRLLVATNEVDEVIQNTTRHVVSSAHVTFSRILTPDVNGNFYCRAAYPIRSIEYNLGIERFEPREALPFYEYALALSEPSFIHRTDPRITDEISRALMLDLASTLCMCPLKVSGQILGLLVLGERRESNREPFDSDKMRLVSAIADQAANALQRANMHEQMENTFVETVLALSNAMDSRDSYTNNHSQRLCTMAEVVCQEMDCSEEEIWSVHWAALLHDIGKIGVPDEILKRPGPLSPEDWVIMKQHPDIGARIVAPVKKLGNVAPLIRAHHEWFDGSGYPLGLKGKEIPIGARILSIADAFTAMTDERVYVKARTQKEAMLELRRKKGSQFDPVLVEVFIDLLERNAFPQVSDIETLSISRINRNPIN